VFACVYLALGAKLCVYVLGVCLCVYAARVYVRGLSYFTMVLVDKLACVALACVGVRLLICCN